MNSLNFLVKDNSLCV